MSFILAIDQGTTGTTSAIIDIESFNIFAKQNLEFPQIYPSPGLVEHDLDDIWNTVSKTITALLCKHNISPSEIKCIGITNQRETTCAFTKDARPLANAIVWQDRRTSEFCKSIKATEKSIQEKTGLPLDPYFSATKMRWLLKNVPLVKEAHRNKDLLFGTIDTFLLYKLTQSSSYKTEASNASRTLLMNLESGQWDEELLSLFEIDRENLPEICDSFFPFGVTKGLDFLPDGIPITGILGDQQAALFGQAGVNVGDTKCTYGTGAFLLFNTGSKIKRSTHGLLSTTAYQHNGKRCYALEGSCYIAGAAVQWLRDNLSIIDTSPDIETLARQVKDLKEMEHLLFLPFFTGIGSPYWNPDAKAAITGITRDTNRSHLARACLDGIAFSINDLLHAMQNDTKIPISSLKVDGGAVQNELLLEIQATISNTTIARPQIIETTAFGAALAAAVGSKIINFDSVATVWKLDREFKKNKATVDFYKNKALQWEKLIKKLF